MNFEIDFNKYYNATLENKKYLLIYFLLVAVLTLSIASLDNYLHPVMEGSIFILTVILGSFSIIYYSLHQCELHKVAFVVIICFGLLCAFLTPIGLVPDEQEHFIRSELTSTGVLVPEPQFVNGTFVGFNTIKGAVDLANDYGNTVFTSSIDNVKIDYSNVIYSSVFMQNPFFGYLAQGIGILLSKLLDLNTIWMLWLGRIANLILYAFLISRAVKKAPIYKIPLMVMACLPLAIFQAASLSIDVMINGLAFLVIGYFLFMYKSKDNSLELKDLAIFSLLALLCGLCKLPYLALIFLLFLIPKDNFKTPFYYNIISFLIVAVLGILWAKFYATPNYMLSYRANYFIEHNVSMSGQINYLAGHLPQAFVTFANAFDYIGIVLFGMFSFSFPPFVYESNLFTLLGLLFVGSVVFLYPYKNELSNKLRIGLLLVVLIVFFGTFTIQLLNWSSVGILYGVDIQSRYFIPLLGLLPLIFGFNKSVDDEEKVNKIIMLISIVLLSALVILTVCRWY